MGKLSMAAMFLMLLFVSTAQAEDFHIGKYGAKSNSDITQALTSAFNEACASTSRGKVIIPQGTYGLRPIKFQGPCKAAIEFQVEGTLTAKTDGTKEPSWVSFNNIDKLTVSGGGVFDGQGPKAWGTCAVGTYCRQLPINLSFNFIKGGRVHDLTCKDSKQFQVNVLGCDDLIFKRFTVSAPEDSPNTDGIHIGRSTKVQILDSHIKTGDDCISIGDGSTNLTIERVTCGPGHGFSIGSLGRYHNEEPVVGVKFRSCTLTGTQNGVRIKTWPAAYPGEVSNMHFEDIIMNNVGNPVLIDQVYCPWNQCNAKQPSKVKISNVVFKNIRGTSSTPVAVKLSCSGGFPCQGVELIDIDLTYSGKDAPAAVSQCSNVHPKVSGKMNPAACTAPVST